jgi:hypothetical protein
MACYSIMLMVFVLTLKKGYYKYQMGQLAWTIAIIVVTVVQVGGRAFLPMGRDARGREGENMAQGQGVGDGPGRKEVVGEAWTIAIIVVTVVQVGVALTSPRGRWGTGGAVKWKAVERIQVRPWEVILPAHPSPTCMPANSAPLPFPSRHRMHTTFFTLLYKPVPAGNRKLERGHFPQSNCISPKRAGRRMIEEIEFYFRLERAYLSPSPISIPCPPLSAFACAGQLFHPKHLQRPILVPVPRRFSHLQRLHGLLLWHRIGCVRRNLIFLQKGGIDVTAVSLMLPHFVVH